MSSDLAGLPEDRFGVYVENDTDDRKIVWLVAQIGEKKLRRAVESIRNKYPDTEPFVSVLLKRFKLKIPTSIFAPVNVPIYRVYVLILRDHSKLKIGFSGDWIRRAYNLIKPPFNTEEVFDFDMSFSVVVGAKKSGARNLESQLLRFFRGKVGYQATAPDELLYFGAGGKLEWFHGFSFEEIKQFLLIDESGFGRSTQSLRNAIDLDINNFDHTNSIH